MSNSITSTQIVLAHLTPGPFVQQVGKTLFDAGMLTRFATTVVERPNANWQKVLCSFAKIANFDLARQFSRRAVTEFPQNLVHDFPGPDLLRLLITRLDKDQRLTDMIFHWGLTGFDHWVAQHQLNGVNAVYGYEYGCLTTFQAAKKKKIACIYDVPSPEHDFVENLLHDELAQFPELNTPYRKYTRVRQERRTQRRRQEWKLADVVIANSEFTKTSYAKAGLDVEKVQVVPLGSPPVCTETETDRNPEFDAVRFLWAGTFSIRKGAHYLLKAWKQLQPGNHADLNVFGAIGLPTPLLENLPESIHFRGTVPRSELYNHYHQSDILVFPTLCDGFGMVVTEAFAQGLPVITTEQAGAADLVRHGVNGLIIPAGDATALAEALDWCMTHREELKAMRQAALETAASWQWSDYRRVLLEKLLNGLQAAGYSQ